MSEDPFSDMRQNLGGFGALGGEGAEAHYTCKVTNDPGKKGRVFQVDCDNCGQPNQVMLNWDEFIFAMSGAVPPGWLYSRAHRALHPNVGCASCNGLMMIVFTPDECKRHLDAGVAQKAVSPQYIQQGVQRVKQAQQGQHG